MLLCLLLLCPALPVFAEGAAMVTIEKRNTTLRWSGWI